MFKNDLHSCIPELHKFVSIVSTIPITTASVENSLSALKRIRLSYVSLISIEKEIVRSMFQEDKFYNIIDHFATIKNRRKPE